MKSEDQTYAGSYARCAFYRPETRFGKYTSSAVCGSTNFQKIACRCEVLLAKSTIDKVASSCDVKVANIIAVHNVPSTYHVPALLEDQDLLPSITKLLRLDLLEKTPQQTANGAKIWKDWKALTAPRSENCKTVTITLVGK